MVYILTILAALIVGIGTVVEQRAAAQSPPEYNLSVKLLLWLVRRRLWLLGVACSLVGNIVFALALGGGNVALVEAVYLARLLFALTLAALWRRHRVALRDALGALIISVGLAGFILGMQPREGTGIRVPNMAWVISGSAIVVFALVLAIIAARRQPVRKAILLGAGGGALFGLQASLTHSAVTLISGSGLLALLTSWQGYTVIAVALFGMLLVQSAYEAAPLPASYPAIVTTQLLSGIALGVWLLGGRIQLDTSSLVIGGLALLGMIAGIYLLTTSPLVTGQFDQLVRQQEVGHARQLEERLEHELGRVTQEEKRAQDQIGARIGTRLDRRFRQDLAKLESGITRLEQLQEDIRRHRDAEQERLPQLPPAERESLVREDRTLREQERRIDEHARRLRETVAGLERRGRQEHPPAGPET
ncbi:DMT family transporter [Haloactinomyces albus]|uniref:Cell division protein FtsB n=1 Tax=Haloactinomyces albus TaxID=1352928 RepID=A0AAE3ZAF4_9ACTN|nr:DMT family transporter [Haloactinomyces albus]MDR7299986.1 cell division protein FtsB [Haloactinomyces albus]